MKYTKTKNGLKISVDNWDNKIVITDKKTNKVIATKTFSDHIVAVLLAKKL